MMTALHRPDEGVRMLVLQQLSDNEDVLSERHRTLGIEWRPVTVGRSLHAHDHAMR